MNPALTLYFCLVPAAFLPVLAHRGFGFGRGFYGVLCGLSLFGTFLFFLGSVAAIHIVSSLSSKIIETVRDINSALAVFCAWAFVGSLLGVCVYRRPILVPGAHKA